MQKKGSAGFAKDAQTGQNLGPLRGNAHIEGRAKYAHDASTKARKDNKLSLSFETVPELIVLHQMNSKMGKHGI